MSSIPFPLPGCTADFISKVYGVFYALFREKVGFTPCSIQDRKNKGYTVMSNFRRDRPQPNRAKIRKCGYTSYACYVSFSTTITVETVKLPNVPNKKKNAANNQVCDAHKGYIKQKRGFYSLVSFASFRPFAVASITI